MADYDLHCLVEIPKGSRNKYQWDEELGGIKLARFLFSSVVYPTDYGFVLASDPAATADQRQQLVSRLPVLLQPAFLFDSAVDLAPSSGFCAELARWLTQWATDRRLDPDRGLRLFDVSLYTTLPDTGAGGADLPRQVPPLLELRSVQLDRRSVLPDPPAAPARSEREGGGP